jgi:16S rRNA (cytosine967-C5)-methyltransferase
MAGVSAARQAAFAILMAVEKSQAHSDDLLRGRAVVALSPPDRHLTTALVLGVLRWQIQLDRQLQSLISRPHAKLDREVLVALRLGAFQLLHLDRIPARAAIDESVELTKRAGHHFASRMVNAVLRRLAASQANAPTGEIDAHPDWSHPAWLVERWKNQFGIETTCAICGYDQSPPPLTVRLGGPAVEAELIAAGIVLQPGTMLKPGTMLTLARAVVSGDVTTTAAFQEGRVRIQDEGSQLVAEIAGFNSDSNQSQTTRILDCCAAPGGKTLILAQRNPQAHIVACEASAPRLEHLRSRLQSLGERIECRLADATALPFTSEFDAVLADVPCSGTGTLGRNPEIRHRLRAEDLPRQAERQRAILSSAIRAVCPGRAVVYSTCSLELEENEEVIAAVREQNTQIEIVPLGSALDALRDRGILSPGAAERLSGCITPEGFLRLTPGRFGTDGFFIAMIKK